MFNEIKFKIYKLISYIFKYIPHGKFRRLFVYYFRFYLIKGYLAEYKLKKGDFVIDGGAFDGFFTFYAAKIVGEKGKIIAFEPDKTNFELLIKTKIRKKFNNVILINKGLWSENKILKFSTTGLKDNMESSLLFNRNDESAIEISVTSVDYELKNREIGKVDFIKMDIEGAEIEAIKGAKNTLKNYDVNLAIASYHIVDGKKTCIKLEKLLREYGYHAYTSFPEHLTTYAYKKRLINN